MTRTNAAPKCSSAPHISSILDLHSLSIYSVESTLTSRFEGFQETFFIISHNRFPSFPTTVNKGRLRQPRKENNFNPCPDSPRIFRSTLVQCSRYIIHLQLSQMPSFLGGFFVCLIKFIKLTPQLLFCFLLFMG